MRKHLERNRKDRDAKFRLMYVLKTITFKPRRNTLTMPQSH